MQHFLDIHKSAPEALRQIIDQAMEMKNDRAGQPRAALDRGRPLAGQMVALIFEKPSTRTRISFDVGVRQMGGETMVLSGADMQLGHGETIADTARVLSRYVDLIMIRTFEEATLLEMAEHASVPVINGLTNRTHPCQIMADIMTFEEHRGPIKGKKVVWSGDGNNVFASFAHAAGQFGFDLTFTGPEPLDPEEVFVNAARAKGVKIEIERNPQKAVEGADLVVTDTWIRVRQMGGETMVLSGADMQLGHGETIADTARVLSRYVDLIMIRTFEEATLLEMAEHASVPVINGLTNRTHPCQIMADIMTFEEHRGPIKGKKVVWSGDGNNVFASFAHAAGQFGFDLTFTGPEPLDPEEVFVNAARAKGVKIEIERNPQKAVEGADLVVTDTWVSMHDPQSARERRHNQLRGYQVNSALMANAKPEALFMHCLPAHREDEATSEVMDSLQSVIFDEAENRLHVQKAIMRHCLGL